MTSKMTAFLLALLCLPINSYIFNSLLFQVFTSLNRLTSFYSEKYLSVSIGVPLREVDLAITYLTAIFALTVIATEYFAVSRPDFRFGRLLINLRFAPIVISIASVLIGAAFDLAMIEISKARVRDYIYNSETVSEPVFKLHNNYRHWCGNGAIAARTMNYLPTAIAGFDSDDPKARQRALLAGDDLVGLPFNGPDAKFDEILMRGCRDDDAAVRATADRILTESRRSSCSKGLTYH